MKESGLGDKKSSYDVYFIELRGLKMFLKRINIILLLFIIIYSGINSLSTVQAAKEIDAKFFDFLLSDGAISGYVLEKQYQTSWPISPAESAAIVRQTWISNDEDIQVRLSICILNSEEAAIRGMHYYTHTTAEPWLWGALFDGILGRHSWRSFNHDNAVLFAYGNIGILISRYKGDDQTVIPLLANAQIKKIKQNLAPEIIQHRETLKVSQLSSAQYNNYLAEKGKVDRKGFTQISNEDSLWLRKDEGLVMGIRREWQDEGRVIGVDICKLESNELANEVATERINMSYGREVNEFEEISWEYSGSCDPFEFEWPPCDDSRSSDVLVCGNVVIHLYTFKDQQVFQDKTTKSSSLKYSFPYIYDPINLWQDVYSPYPIYFPSIFNSIFDDMSPSETFAQWSPFSSGYGYYGSFYGGYGGYPG